MSVPPQIQVPDSWLAGLNTEYTTQIDEGGKHCAVLKGHNPSSDLEFVFIIKYDHAHNRFFFVNKLTRDKTWELPDSSVLYRQAATTTSSSSSSPKNVMDRDYAKNPPTFMKPSSSQQQQADQPVTNEMFSRTMMSNNNQNPNQQPSSPSASPPSPPKLQPQQSSTTTASTTTATSYFDENDILDVPLLKHEIQRLAESLKDRDKLIAQFQTSFSTHQNAIRSLSHEVTRLKSHSPEASSSRAGSASRSPMRDQNNHNTSENNKNTNNESEIIIEELKKQNATLRRELEHEQEQLAELRNSNKNQLIQDQTALIENLRKKIDDEINEKEDLIVALNQSKQNHHHEVETLQKSLEHEQEKNLMMMKRERSDDKTNVTAASTATSNVQQQQEMDKLSEELLRTRKRLVSIEAILSQNEPSPFITERNNNNNNNNNNNSSPLTKPAAVLNVPDEDSVHSTNPVDLVNALVKEVKQLREENQEFKRARETKIEINSSDESHSSSSKTEQTLIKNYLVLLSNLREESAALTLTQMEALSELSCQNIQHQMQRAFEGRQFQDKIQKMKEENATTVLSDVDAKKTEGMMMRQIMMDRELALFNSFEQDDRIRIENEERYDSFPTLRMLWKVIKMHEKDLEAKRTKQEEREENQEVHEKPNKKSEDDDNNSSDDELHEQLSLGLNPKPKSITTTEVNPKITTKATLATTLEGLFKHSEVLSNVYFAEKQNLLDSSRVKLNNLMMNNNNKNNNSQLMNPSSLLEMSTTAVQSHLGLIEALSIVCHSEKSLEKMKAEMKM